MKRTLFFSLMLTLPFLTFPSMSLTDDECSEARRKGGYIGWRISQELKNKSPQYKNCYLDEMYEKMDLARKR